MLFVYKSTYSKKWRLITYKYHCISQIYILIENSLPAVPPVVKVHKILLGIDIYLVGIPVYILFNKLGISAWCNG